MRPLKITARLSAGFISSDPWSPSIDGILAYQFMREKLGPEEFAISQHRSDMMQVVEGLPLAVERYGDWWWYQCSSPIYRSQLEMSRYLHRRFDAKQAERYWTDEGKSGKVLTAAGPYKNARLNYTQHITPKVEWHVVGDEAEIRRLLMRVTHIGGRVGSGFGKVRDWEIGDGDESLARLRRPLPKSFAQEHGIVGQEMIWGLRPPGRHPDNRTECVMP